MSATEASYSTVDGAPLYYVRNGSMQRTTVRSTYSHERKMDRFIRDLRNFTQWRFGTLTGVATAGFYVNKPGAHGMGRAMDLDRVYWQRLTISPLSRDHASSNIATRRRYLALDAVARREWKYCLDGYYNAAHGDHLHLDDTGGRLVLNKSSRSDVVFIQKCCNDFCGTNIAVDGDYGPGTDRAYRTLKARARVTGDTSSDPYQYCLLMLRIADAGFDNRGL